MIQHIREVIYFAVRDYPCECIIQRLLTSEVNVVTGEKLSTVERIPARAAKLPRYQTRQKFGQHLCDVGETEFIFSVRDLDSLSASDAILAEGRLYQIETAEDLSGEGWIVRARDIGAAPDPIEESVSNELAPGVHVDN